MGGEAIGLLRSEFLFLERRTAPSEDEQAAAYEAIIREVGPERLVVVRTLDVGGDKPLSYLPVAAEANPFLGERGIRLLLNRPEFFAARVRAILRASPCRQSGRDVSHDLDVGEWRAAHELVELQRLAVGVPPLPVGIMIETASAALLADRFRGGRGFLLHRHERSDAVHARHGSHQPGARAAGGRACIRRCCV